MSLMSGSLWPGFLDALSKKADTGGPNEFKRMISALHKEPQERLVVEVQANTTEVEVKDSCGHVTKEKRLKIGYESQDTFTVASIAQILWSAGALKVKGTDFGQNGAFNTTADADPDHHELCWWVSFAIRKNKRALLEPVAPYCRALTSFTAVDQEKRKEEPMKIPEQLWRGGGFNEDHRKWFEEHKGQVAQVPSFWATTDKLDIVIKFCLRAAKSGFPPVTWKIEMDKDKGCLHVNFIT